MGQASSTDVSVALLRRALADPFVLVEAYATGAVFEWYALALREAPLWCYRGLSYKALNGSWSLSTHPLKIIIDQILADEGLSRESLWRINSPLEECLLSCRSDLSDGAERPSACVLQEGKPFVSSFLGWERAHELSDRVDYDEAGPIGSVSPYDELGRELVAFIEELQQSEGKRSRKEHQRAIEEFLESTGARLPTGRPAKGGSKEVVQRIYQQGRPLIEAAWNTLPAEPSPQTRAVLFELGADDALLWCARLALPFLSRRELIALLSEIETARVTKRGTRPTPRRFVVWCIAHRLGVEPATIAEKIPPVRSDLTYFTNKKNPI